MTAAVKRSWELPAHRAVVFSQKRHEHALVIPVLNEGDRIRRQLEQLQAMAFPIDIIIADGNSSDGSTTEEFLRRVGACALLVKTSPGRLSAQLRMAYAWCLDEGYAGILTVDGNGKDGLAAIPGFIALLQQGYDYVQGSRYAAGGNAVNTPLDRTLGGRLVHAPLISLVARHHLTDTTNGFRAYSARALLDPRVSPFRAVFDRYSLLFYLSIRLPKLGYKTTELGVTRAYPTSGKTPTKISGISSRLALARELLTAVTGGYDPKDGKS
jgi:dolichol-phosphate mannosyltransferase